MIPILFTAETTVYVVIIHQDLLFPYQNYISDIILLFINTILYLFNPAFDQRLSGWRSPILFNICMAFPTKTLSEMVTVETFKRFIASSMKFTKTIFQKITPVVCISLQSVLPTTTFKCGGKHAESHFR
ncbi:MAG TPA: hypothetical protein DCZ10_06550 [Pelotomaculum sp.]|nr:hypothetical protein [Pelotomaculum sp.]